jgi:hypothetical protein
MPRPRAKIELTLFPFLSVLAGLIAVMMLFMMITLGTRVIGEESEGEQARAAEPKPETNLSDDEKSDDTDAGIDETRWQALNDEINKLTADLIQRRNQHVELARSVEQLEALVELNKNQMDLKPPQVTAGKVLGAPRQVEVVPAKGDFKFYKKAHYVEVTAAGYLLYPDKTLFPPVQRREAASGDTFTVDPKLSAFLDSVSAKRKKEFIVFLVHPSGTTVFNSMLRYLDQRYPLVNNPSAEFDTGWEPFPQGWVYVPGRE